MIRLFVILLAFTACASKEYVRDGVSYEKQVWRFCSLEKDGPEKALTGYCYIDRVCRKRIFRKKECKPVPLYCKWGDIPCMTKYKILGKKIKH